MNMVKMNQLNHKLRFFIFRRGKGMIKFLNCMKKNKASKIAPHIQTAIAKMNLTIARTQQSKAHLFQTDYLEQ